MPQEYINLIIYFSIIVPVFVTLNVLYIVFSKKENLKKAQKILLEGRIKWKNG